MKIPVEYKIISDDASWENDWKYLEIDVNPIDYCRCKWVMKKKIFRPRSFSSYLLTRVMNLCESRIKAHEAELLAELNRNYSTFIDWDFYEPNRRDADYSEPFVCIYGREIDWMFREIEKLRECELSDTVSTENEGSKYV